MHTHEHTFITFYIIIPSIQYEYHWHWFQYHSISFIRFFYVLYKVMIIIFIFWIIIDVNIHPNSTVAFTFIEFLEQSLDPYNKKLHTDTWYYAKRCFLALAENMSKHMLILKVSTYVRTVWKPSNCRKTIWFDQIRLTAWCCDIVIWYNLISFFTL